MTLGLWTSECSFTEGYEKLRSCVLEARIAGGHFGLVILLREGVAAWMANAFSLIATEARSAAQDRPATALIPDGLRADVARVFASMVMTTSRERCA